MRDNQAQILHASTTEGLLPKHKEVIWQRSKRSLNTNHKVFDKLQKHSNSSMSFNLAVLKLA